MTELLFAYTLDICTAICLSALLYIHICTDKCISAMLHAYLQYYLHITKEEEKEDLPVRVVKGKL